MLENYHKYVFLQVEAQIHSLVTTMFMYVTITDMIILTSVISADTGHWQVYGGGGGALRHHSVLGL